MRHAAVVTGAGLAYANPVMLDCERHAEILRLRMGRSWLGHSYYTAGYLVDDLVVDTGCAHTVRELVGALSALPTVPRRIVNTHCHEDHFAGNAALKRRFGAEASAHPLALPVLERPRSVRCQLYRHLVWGIPEGAPARALGERVETDRHCFEVIPTPGHSTDSISLFERQRGWLFTGDAFVGGRDRALRHDSDVWAIITSLERMRALSPGLLLTGSGSLYERPDEALALKLEHLRETGARVLAMHERGLDERTILKRVLGGEQLIGYLSEGDFSGLSLVRSYLRGAPAGGGRPA